jgi:hypothetical protein
MHEFLKGAIQFKLNNDKPFNDHEITGNIALQETWC